MKKLLTLFCGCILLFSGCSKEPKDQPGLSIPEMEQQVIELVNRKRSDAGLDALQREESLMASCNIRAEELVTRFSHTRPDGSQWSTAITTTDITRGENIAFGQSSAEDVMNAWMNSQGHRENILNVNYTHIGVGCYKHNGILYWVQLFIGR